MVLAREINKKPPPSISASGVGLYSHKKCMNFLFLNLLSSKRAQSSSFYRADPTENWPEITLWRTQTVFLYIFWSWGLKKIEKHAILDVFGHKNA